jgi:hypothetical protein
VETSCQVGHANDSKSLCGTSLESQQESRLNEKGISRGYREFEDWETQLTAFQVEVQDAELGALVEHPDIGIGPFVDCQLHHQTVLKVACEYLCLDAFPEKKRMITLSSSSMTGGKIPN